MSVMVRANSNATINVNGMNLLFSLKYKFSMIILLALILFSSFGLIYIKDLNRRTVGNIQSLQDAEESMQSQHSQLLLEKSAWASDARVEQIATTQLHMIPPPAKSIVVV